MARVGFEPTTPVFDRAKVVHALDCAVTVIGHNSAMQSEIIVRRKKGCVFYTRIHKLVLTTFPSFYTHVIKICFITTL
jgi:hypothetical protein